MVHRYEPDIQFGRWLFKTFPLHVPGRVGPLREPVPGRGGFAFRLVSSFIWFIQEMLSPNTTSFFSLSASRFIKTPPSRQKVDNEHALIILGCDTCQEFLDHSPRRRNPPLLDLTGKRFKLQCVSQWSQTFQS